MAQWLPTAHFGTAFAVNDSCWQTHGADIAARWQAWREQPH
jgi:hypothetical protein